MKGIWAWTGLTLTLATIGLVVGCDSDVDTHEPAPGGAGGVAGAGGEAGQGGEPGRGDPSQFPTDCFEECTDACDAVVDCGGESSPVFPIDREECMSRCALQENGYVWPDLTANFKCCASQTQCSDVAHCGGWLKHPDVVNSCVKMCECLSAYLVELLTAGRQAPGGYRFAPDALIVDTGEASVDLSSVRGVHVVREGRYQLVRLDSDADMDTLAELERVGRVLPTFVDGAGRASAAVGNIVLVVEEANAKIAALAVGARHGLTKHRALKTRLSQLPAARLYVLEGSDGWRALDALAELSQVAGLRAELDQVRYYDKRYTPNDPLYAEQWHLENTGQNGSTVSVDGRVSEAWDVTLGDAQVLIAINDDGVDLNHPDFAGKLEPELNFPSDWEDQLATGFSGHGTSVAGVAAALGDNSEGGSGVCPNCRIIPHLLGPSTGLGFNITDAEVAEGFERMVDAGAWVINNSWGISTGNPVYVETGFPVPDIAAVVQASFDYAETSGRGGLGTVILFANGNDNDVLGPNTSYVTNVAVAAVGDLGLKSYYSSFGPETDLAAPSNGALNGITTTAAQSQYTDSFGGTSSACPFATGVAGLVLSADPTLTAKEVRDILAATATKIDPVYGQWDAGGHSDFYGAGLVNAYAAVQLAAGGCATAAECIAPSDDCGSSCGTLTSCQVCRTQADCAADHACQALPSLGQLVCVAAKGAGNCPGGTNEVNDYCLPTPTTCGICTSTEECNGRDDDCNGEVDDGGACSGAAYCFIDGPGCGTGMVCAGVRCTDECDEDADCPSEDQSCEQLKNQYGEVTGVWGCVTSYASMCQWGCEVLASSLPDDELAAYVECMDDGNAACSDVLGCAMMLPIEF